jgi:integrase
MSLKLYRRGEIWHYRGTVAGRLLRGSTKTPDKTTAQRIAAEIEARQWKGHLDGPGAVLTFAQAAMIYLEAQKPPRFIAKVAAYWKDTPVRQITPGAIRQAAITLYPTHSGATRNRQIIVPAQAIINHAAEQELCQRIRVKRFPVTKQEKEPASWTWVQAFMSASKPHLGALACFMFLTGARITESLSLGWSEVDLSSRRALIRQTKIGAERWAHLPPPLVAALANIPDRKPKVFKYSDRKAATKPWNKAIERAGIKPLSFHACRHGFATASLQAGIDPVTVAKLGGWKSPQHVFSTYGHAMSDETVTDRIIGTPATQERFIAKRESA